MASYVLVRQGMKIHYTTVNFYRWLLSTIVFFTVSAGAEYTEYDNWEDCGKYEMEFYENLFKLKKDGHDLRLLLSGRSLSVEN